MMQRLLEDHSWAIAPGIGFLLFVLMIVGLIARRKWLDRQQKKQDS